MGKDPLPSIKFTWWMNKSTAVPKSTVGKWSEKKETKNNYVTFIWTLVSEQSAEEGKLNQKMTPQNLHFTWKNLVSTMFYCQITKKSEKNNSFDFTLDRSTTAHWHDYLNNLIRSVKTFTVCSFPLIVMSLILSNSYSNN